MVRLRNTVVIGFAGGVVVDGWAARLAGRASARSTAYDGIFIRPPGGMVRDRSVDSRWRGQPALQCRARLRLLRLRALDGSKVRSGAGRGTGAWTGRASSLTPARS